MLMLIEYSKTKTMTELHDLPALKFTPLEARAMAMASHANTITNRVESAAEQGIYPSELGAFVLNQFLDFDGPNFTNHEVPTAVQAALIDRSGPGQAERNPHEALMAARDGTGAKKMIRSGIASARRKTFYQGVVSSAGNSGPLPTRSVEQPLIIRVGEELGP